MQNHEQKKNVKKCENSRFYGQNKLFLRTVKVGVSKKVVPTRILANVSVSNKFIV
jgi:hypothetical protein